MRLRPSVGVYPDQKECGGPAFDDSEFAQLHTLECGEAAAAIGADATAIESDPSSPGREILHLTFRLPQ